MMQLDKIIRLSEPNPSLPSNLCVSPKTPSLQTMAAFPICSTSNSPLKVTAKSPAPAPAPAPFAQKRNQLSLRREFLKGLSLLPLLELKHPRPSSAAKEIEVGVYLPPSPSDPSFVFFKASPKDTPALRAGNVQPYQFIIPPTWKQTRVANILSGNYCQPKCAEPWVEVKFEDDKQGKVQVVASPLIRLTNKPNASIEEIGSPEKLIASLGPFVTGNTYDPDELLETQVEKLGDQTYYKYVLETPFALTGSHNLAKATAKGNTVVLFVASANDKQWQTSEKTLKAMLDSFQV
ncbi:psbP domain-containing protein 6, chloroplastic [Alnus glutinosa]|uniref:psbP domain-containing protein 6, chloroplastic n=1 Tax=Alnus glutinosa TaxID=3517 RepID=UPI002D79B4E9|nr:psbP domain-containing protein 6, chloroplastic [Alnus glutinosa]